MGLVNVSIREDEWKNSRRFKTYCDGDPGGVYKKCGINHIFMNFHHYFDDTIVKILSVSLDESHRIHIFISDRKFVNEELKWFINNYHTRTLKKIIIHIPKSNVGLAVAIDELLGKSIHYCKILIDSCPTEFYMIDNWEYTGIPASVRTHSQVMLHIEMSPQSQHFIRYSYREKTNEEMVEERRRMLNAEENRKKIRAEKMAKIPRSET